MIRLLIFFALLVSASASQLMANEIISIDLESKNLNEVRPVFIRLPANYAAEPTKKYPTLYILNEKDNFDWASYIVELQASRFGIEDMLVVGLPHTGNYWDDNHPFAEEKGLKPSAQAQKYSAFIREEIIPYMEKNYRANDGRFIVGHSISGLFVTHLFMQHPDSFSTFIALSPSFHQAPQMPEAVEQFLKSGQIVQSQIYMSLGRLEHEQIQKGYGQVRQLFEDYAPQNLRYHIGYMDDTDHLLSAFNGTYGALAWVYADYTIQSEIAQNLSYEDFIRHYDTLSERLNYEVKPRERFLTGFAQFLAKRVGNLKAGLIMIAVARHYYPQSEDVQKLTDEFAKLMPKTN